MTAGNINILCAHPHSSHPSQNGSPVGKIVFFSKVVKSLYYKDPELWVKVNAKEYLIQYLPGNVEPADDLYGTWERKETVSILRLEGKHFSYTQWISQGSMMKIERDIHNWFKFEIIDEGEWVKEDPQSDLESPIREFSFIRQNQLPCLKSKV